MINKIVIQVNSSYESMIVQDQLFKWGFGWSNFGKRYQS
jgi:hypothetical protein